MNRYAQKSVGLMRAQSVSPLAGFASKPLALMIYHPVRKGSRFATALT